MDKNRIDRGVIGVSTSRPTHQDRLGHPEPIRRQPAMMGMDILRLRKQGYILEEMRLESSHPLKRNRRIPLLSDRVEKTN